MANDPSNLVEVVQDLQNDTQVLISDLYRLIEDSDNPMTVEISRDLAVRITTIMSSEVSMLGKMAEQIVILLDACKRALNLAEERSG